MSTLPQDDPSGRWFGPLGEVRERLARLETRSESHDSASAERHRQVLDALQRLEARLANVESRSWRIALAVGMIGVGGGVGAVELLRALTGGA